MDVLEIIDNITGFIQYFATGFLFLGSYNFAAFLQRESQAEYFIVKSITVSFIINSLTGFVIKQFGLDTQYYYALLIIISCTAGLVLGRARRVARVRWIISKVFSRTISDNIFVTIWEIAVKGKCICIRFRLKDDAKYYEGQIGRISSVYQEPTILLKYYIVCDEDGNPIRDFSECDNACMIVQWSQMENIEIASEGLQGI